jgi:hypothetical protein
LSFLTYPFLVKNKQKEDWDEIYEKRCSGNKK